MSRILLLSILFSIVQVSVGQSFHIRFDDSVETLKDETTLTITHETNTLIQEHFYIHNLSDHEVDITVQRNDSILPEGFQSMFCLNICYTPETIEATETLAVGDSVFFTIDLYPYDLTGDAFIEYTITSEPDQDTIHFFVTFEVTSVGINDINQNALVVYPNPAENIINFNNLNQIVEYRIYNASGQVLITSKMAQSETSIDVSALMPGLYFIQLCSEKGENKTTQFYKK
jgi:hypothetical protein